MKNIYKIIALFLLAISCKAQSPIINIEDQNGDVIQNAYYKDTNNLLNPFVGTYIYTNGTTLLKIVLQKKILSFDGYCYEDMLIGEYQYIENGVEKMNTLDELNLSYTNQSNHSINGNYVYTNGSYWCTDCSPNEKRVMGGLAEHATSSVAQLLISRTVTNTGEPAIKLNVMWEMKWHNPDIEAPKPQPSFPGGDYILIKQ